MPDFKYVPTRVSTPVMSHYVDYLRAVNTDQSLSLLGLKPGSVDCLVFLIDYQGFLHQIHPNERKTGFELISGQTSLKDYEIPLVTYWMRRMEEIWSPLAPGDSRAIVHLDYEPKFQDIAMALGREPVKITGELFLTEKSRLLVSGNFFELMKSKDFINPDVFN